MSPSYSTSSDLQCDSDSDSSDEMWLQENDDEDELTSNHFNVTRIIGRIPFIKYDSCYSFSTSLSPSFSLSGSDALRNASYFHVEGCDSSGEETEMKLLSKEARAVLARVPVIHFTNISHNATAIKSSSTTGSTSGSVLKEQLSTVDHEERFVHDEESDETSSTTERRHQAIERWQAKKLRRGHNRNSYPEYDCRRNVAIKVRANKIRNIFLSNNFFF